ncbi:aldose 1-epimerase family protein [Flavobacterium sp. CYK-4]|uniref:aldose 1-epimerase family protein n=1 Tax=Flavobacterium lotistagni TaxID=2709660 RepID=UPI00140C09AA|nr:aldose 1-epimerase family protein [Flavobacterium lotistagni]NHM06987.1 aldose 1-epimerase family protein [Flavobacterium lotistagni]
MTVSIENSQLTATINSKGAELISLRKNSDNREYIWNAHPAFWGKHAPVLFPIVGTLKDNQYVFNDKTYSLLRHGFARDYEFELISNSATEVVFSLKANAETLRVYPFDFELQLIYKLEENALIVGYKVINKTTATMPFSIGGHPAFALPKTFDNYSLLFEFQETLKQYSLKHDLLSEVTIPIELEHKKLPLNYRLFENDAMVFKSMKSKKITILENEHSLLNFHYKDFENFGIWTKPGAAFICLEPWLGYSDTTNHNGNIIQKEAIQKLAPQSQFNGQFQIEIF